MSMMRHSLLLGLRISFAAALLFAAAGACSGTGFTYCGDTLTCSEEGGDVGSSSTGTGDGGSDPICTGDPAKDPIEVGCGVFVSASLGDDANVGSRDAPVRTMAKAIALAGQSEGPRLVHACAETFAEAVIVPAGTTIWGGLDCHAGWVWIGDDAKTIFAPLSNQTALTMQGGEGMTIVADVQAQAAGATVPGGSSIAAQALPGATVEILRSRLIAGNGARGADGAPGNEHNLPAPGGTQGNPGASACSADMVAGAVEVKSECGAIDSIGGPGGIGGPSMGGTGFDGLPMPSPNPYGFGLGGAGESNGVQCFSGAMGENGADGEHGLGGQQSAYLSFTGYNGRSGENGTLGLPGQGGGGGGGSKAGLLFCGAAPQGGASGGSGGGGGCGGRAGAGGGFGGASIGLISMGATVALRDCVVTVGDGGDGGAGGRFQIGGPGGIEGQGGQGTGGSKAGCQGGIGGQGGNGGNGGGGLGGPSIGLAYVLGVPVATEGVLIQLGKPGFGGLGGNPNLTWTTGKDGVVGDDVGFPPPAG